MAYAGRLHPKRVHFSGFGYIKELNSKISGNERVGKYAMKQRTTLGPGYHRLFMRFFRFWSS